MRLFRPLFFARLFYPEGLFRIKTTEKNIWLTFDDGPDPESTLVFLEILRKHDVKALFFCNGSAAEKYPDLIELIKSKGHTIGNHGYSHFNGWKTSSSEYVSDVERAKAFTSSVYFRPPYGRLRINQYLKLKRKYKIIFWDLMPYDFDKSFGPEKALKVLLRKVRPGSVIVLHDRPDSTLINKLDEFIVAIRKEGYGFGLPGGRG